MSGLLLVGLLALVALAAGASRAKAATTIPPTPTPSTQIKIRRPREPIRRARAQALDELKAPEIKEIESELDAGLPGVEPDATDTLKNLLNTATNETAPPAQRAAARKRIAKIAEKPAELRVNEINKLPTEAKVELAKAVLKNEEQAPTADQAAKSLQIYTRGGGDQGNKSKPSATVSKAQKLMGLKPDGIIGPDTRKRAEQLGYPLARRAEQAPPAPTRKPAALPPKPATTVTVRKPPETERQARARVLTASRTPAARAVQQARPSAPLAPDAGQAMKNMLATAIDQHSAPAPRAAAREQVKKIVAQPAAVRKTEVQALPPAAKAELAKSIVSNEQQPTSPDQAAQALQIWTRGGGNQGSRDNPSQTVKKAQQAMGLTADGIIGPDTRKRAAALGYPLALRTAQKPGAVGLGFRATPTGTSIASPWTRGGANQGLSPFEVLSRARKQFGTTTSSMLSRATTQELPGIKQMSSPGSRDEGSEE